MINSTNTSAYQLFINFTNLSEGTYYLNATVNDTVGNSNKTETRIIVLDTTPPNITIISPTNGISLSSGTTQTTLKITTDKNATCRYSTSSTFNFSDGTNFTNTMGLNHSHLYTGLSNGQSCSLYYKCNDSAGNVNNQSMHNYFSVDSPADDGNGGGGGGGGGGAPATSDKITLTNKESITRIEVNLDKSVTSPSLKVESLTTVPLLKPVGTVYGYINVTKKNFNNSIIKNATIDFRVNNSWIDKNKIIRVYLGRYEDKWMKLRTELTIKTENYTDYRAYTNSFSYFAMIGLTKISVCEEEEKRCSENSLEQCINNLWQIIEICGYGCNSTSLTCNLIRLVCNEGEKRCMENELQECADNNWTTIEICDYECNPTILSCTIPEKPIMPNYWLYPLVAIIMGMVICILYLEKERIRVIAEHIKIIYLKEKEKTKSKKILSKLNTLDELTHRIDMEGKDTVKLELELKTAKKNRELGLFEKANYKIKRAHEELEKTMDKLPEEKTDKLEVIQDINKLAELINQLKALGSDTTKLETELEEAKANLKLGLIYIVKYQVKKLLDRIESR